MTQFSCEEGIQGFGNALIMWYFPVFTHCLIAISHHGLTGALEGLQQPLLSVIVLSVWTCFFCIAICNLFLQHRNVEFMTQLMKVRGKVEVCIFMLEQQTETEEILGQVRYGLILPMDGFSVEEVCP